MHTSAASMCAAATLAYSAASRLEVLKNRKAISCRI